MRLWSGTEPGLSAPAARERLLSGWADRRHGIVTVAELRALGFDSSAVRRRVLAGRLHRLYPGVYSYGRRTLTAYGRVLAAVAACGPLAAASHRTAAALWDLRPSERLEVIVPSASGRRHPPGVRLHRHATLRPQDVTSVHDIPVTTVARTLLDLASVVKPQQLEAAVRQADDAELFDLGEVEEVVAAYPRHRGARRLRELLAELRDRDVHLTFSELERAFLALCDDYGLPRPRTNALVNGYRVDFHWPGTPVIVEADSWRWHRGRARFESDRLRDQHLILAGYLVLRVTHHQLVSQPHAVAHRIARLLATGPR